MVLSGLQKRLHELHTPISTIPVLSASIGQLEQRPRPAAVLVPIQLEPYPTILLTLRSQRLQQHPGQISFPGGGAEAADNGPTGTALREAWEEVGLPREQVQPLGYLDRLDTISGYRVVPVVAHIIGQPALRLDPSEVAQAFRVPLEFALERNNYQFEKREYANTRYQLPVLQYQEWRVWGATAIILWRLCKTYSAMTGAYDGGNGHARNQDGNA